MPENTTTTTDQATCNCGCCGPADPGATTSARPADGGAAAGCQCGAGATDGPGTCGCGAGGRADAGACGCGAGAA
jgi:hypothetical protein